MKQSATVAAAKLTAILPDSEKGYYYRNATLVIVNVNVNTDAFDQQGRALHLRAGTV